MNFGFRVRLNRGFEPSVNFSVDYPHFFGNFSKTGVKSEVAELVCEIMGRLLWEIMGRLLPEL